MVRTAARVPGHQGQQLAVVQERHHADFVGEDADRPRPEPARGHVPERSSFLPVNAGSVSPQEASTDPSGEKASHSAAPRCPGRVVRERRGGNVPEDDAAGRVARCEGAAVGGQVDATDRRLVVPEQRDFATARPPEVPPGEVAMPGSGPVDVVEEDLLGSFELPDVERLAGQP